ncbi:RepB family plasmid replication initiator protein [Enterococcus faecium]|uniref:replication initiation protein n=1 Tax=Enterococcus faecium TaxID=1352 RepID=UPI0015E44B72|nr:replication initiation protein [Enterococcus faecium]EME3547184.1 RepB family plasmid replication initiator protein [Enterococcus faecium]
MEDLSKLNVFQKNKLIESSVKMDTVPLKIFELAVAAIDDDVALNGKELEDNTVFIHKSVLYKFFDNTSTNKYSRLKKYLSELRKKAHMEITNEVSKDKYEYIDIGVVAATRYSNYDDYIAISFTPQIMPYILDLKRTGFYTKYKIKDISKMNSKYSIILFKWLMLNFNQYQYYKNKDNRNSQQKYDYQNPKISIQDFRALTDTRDRYKSFTNLEYRTLTIPLEEINKYTDINVTYQKIGKHKVTGIQFFITEKPKRKVISPTEEPIVTKEELEEQENQLFISGVTSKYTSLLSKNMLLGVDDITSNKSLIVNLAKEVYPLYEKFENDFGFNELEKHVKYIVSKKRGTIRNLPSFLKVSIEQYRPRAAIKYFED